jgi:crotonobetainyl-CoA:carnitine CoA-transferase CaiB-like acyl-CoA transferase
MTGMLGAVSVLASLVARERESGPSAGLGQRVDISLLASTLSALVNQAQNAFVSGVAPVRRGNAHPNIVPYETFETADGEIAVAVGSERQWPRVCVALGLPALADDPRYATNGDRVERRGELRPTLAERFLERTTDEWLAALEAADIPAGPINDVLAAFAAPEAVSLGMTVEMEHPAWGVIRQVGVPFTFSGTPASVRTPPPMLGADTDAILAEAGYDAAAIRALREANVV